VPQLPLLHPLLLKADHLLLWVFAQLLRYYHGGAPRNLAGNLPYPALLTPPLPKPPCEFSKLPRVCDVLSPLFLIFPRVWVFLLQLFKLCVSDGFVSLRKSAEVCPYRVHCWVYVLPIPAGDSVHSRLETQPGDCYRVFVYVKGDNLSRRLTLGHYIKDEDGVPLIPPPL
jgi:hypothetical protein